MAATEARHGYPVLTATAAIAAQLARLGAHRIALVAPYPDWLLEAAHAYWTALGLDVTTTRRIATARPGDPSAIYELISADALAAVRALGAVGADAVLVSGTGLATLRILAAARASAGVPVPASNVALAEAAVAIIRDKNPRTGT